MEFRLCHSLTISSYIDINLQLRLDPRQHGKYWLSKRHTIKPGTPEHGTTGHGKPAERRNNAGTPEHRTTERGTPAEYIRGYKGQNSTGTRCRGFLALESGYRGFLVLESQCHGFLFSKKTPWNHDVVAYLSPFLDVVVFWSWNLDVVAFWSWNLDVVTFWSWNLDVVVFQSWNFDVVVFSSWNLHVVAFWSWNLDIVVYVPPRSRFRFH